MMSKLPMLLERKWESGYESCKGLRPLCARIVAIGRRTIQQGGPFTIKSTFNSFLKLTRNVTEIAIDVSVGCPPVCVVKVQGLSQEWIHCPGSGFCYRVRVCFG